MDINESNINIVPTADTLPCFRKLLLRDIPPQKHMQVCVSVFLKFQDGDKGERPLELTREEYAHLPPALPDVAIRSLTLLYRDALGIQRKRSHTSQLVLRSYLSESRAHFFQFGVTASVTAIRTAKQTLVPKLPRFAL